jgi:ABC-type nitrate/sulfonate/bicarbonate transport system ATPase subunit/ABC-type transporter Mla maintaining outer membrane lipid asymmetry permease subunit MlaE
VALLASRVKRVVPCGAMLVRVRDLSVALPGGAVVVRGADLAIAPGEVVALLGPSGGGKSTLLRALLDPAALRAEGFELSWAERELGAKPAFVPQRGALLDHLDTRGNIALAAAHPERADEWLEAVELDTELGPRPVASLSGGQAQRVAVARALAAGRKLIVLDEPSVGLDPLGVRRLAQLLCTQARQHGAGILVITHDLSLATGAADRLLFLDPKREALCDVLEGWKGPAEERPEERDQSLLEVEDAVERLLAGASAPRGAVRKRRNPFALLAPFGAAGAGLLRTFEPGMFGASMRVLAVALLQSLLRPILFYAIVAVLLGVTVPYVVVHISAGIKPGVMLGMIGGSYILALAPPVSAIVYAATSGSAINAWLGGMGLRGQVVALQGLGVDPRRYLDAPAWMALAVGYLVSAGVFVASMIAGGYLLFQKYAVPNALDVLTADFLDPAPERIAYRWRGIWLVVCYGLAIASIVVAKAREPKDRSDQVTASMTSGVMRSTLLVVVLELVSVAILFSVTGEGM